MFFDYFLYNEKFKIVLDWEFFIYIICIENRFFKYLKMIICNYDFIGILFKKDNRFIVDLEKKIVFDKYFFYFIENYKLVSEIKLKRM